MCRSQQPYRLQTWLVCTQSFSFFFIYARFATPNAKWNKSRMAMIAHKMPQRPDFINGQHTMGKQSANFHISYNVIIMIECTAYKYKWQVTRSTKEKISQCVTKKKIWIIKLARLSLHVCRACSRSLALSLYYVNAAPPFPRKPIATESEHSNGANVSNNFNWPALH